MAKKLTFLFIITFVIALVWFSSYLIVKEVRGVMVGNNLIMGGNRIYNVSDPEADTDLVTKGYLERLPILYLDGYSIDSWCDVQYFDWCSGAEDPYPPAEEEPEEEPPIL